VAKHDLRSWEYSLFLYIFRKNYTIHVEVRN